MSSSGSWIRSVGTVTVQQTSSGFFFQEAAKNIPFVGRSFYTHTRYEVRIRVFQRPRERTHVHTHTHAMQLYPSRTHLNIARYPQMQRTGGWSADVGKRKGLKGKGKKGGMVQEGEGYFFCRDEKGRRKDLG